MEGGGGGKRYDLSRLPVLKTILVAVKKNSLNEDKTKGS